MNEIIPCSRPFQVTPEGKIILSQNYNGLCPEMFLVELVENNCELRQRLIKTNPDLALKLINLAGAGSLRQDFVENWKDSSEYHHSCCFVSSIPRKAISETYIKGSGWSIEEVQRWNQKVIAEKIHFYGSLKHAGNWWAENEWDNIVKLSEE